MLTAEDRRCLGQLPNFHAGTIPCARRNECQRYIQRDSGKEKWTLTAAWMCPGPDDYWQYLIPVEVK